ncbi:MAG TPA: Trk system potassium transporter TrkA [Bacteroidales bacterium]|nr:Trk system potassium transporter TrkA [Bacteroidales bacterium]HOQ96291.1 Trk system potassium transporter TrkA [Bacteroidales bacterium]HPL84401.1 Trk system potassium transporter TrkA [Bacteroidales bacterium]
MNIIIAGAGEVGFHLAKMLSDENHQITIVDKNEARLIQIAETSDVVPVAGIVTSISTLEKAGISRCDLFIAVSPAEEQDMNIVAALLAKQLGAKRVTARINNNEYLKQENRVLFTEMGIDLLFYPENIAAHEIVDLLKQSGTSEFMDFSGGRLQLIVLKLQESSSIVNKSLKQVAEENGGNIPFRAVAIAREGNTIIPRKDTVFQLHDLVFVITKREAAHAAMVLTGKENMVVRNLMIMGGGRVGEMVAHQMESAIEIIRIVEIDSNRCRELTVSLPRSLIINGDARNTDLLLEEDLTQMDAFVAVTSSAEANILSCMAAKRAGVKKAIAQVENLDYIKLAESVGVDATINKKLITASRIFRFTMTGDVPTMKCLNGSDAEVMEFIAKPRSLVTQKIVRDLGFPRDAIIGGITRGNTSLIVRGDTEIKPYDRVVVFSLPSALPTIHRFFV